ncbi:MAG: HNH endonuclease [Nanoarchaeota archaeon]
MKKHTKIYLKYFGYGEQDFIPCEICGNKAVDIHHIERRGMGGSKLKDVISNLMGLCRKCHDKYGDKKQFKDWLKKIHQIYLFNRKC